MQHKGHEFLVSARNKEVSQSLLSNYDIPYFDRGRGSNNLLGKVAYVVKADSLIYRVAMNFKPDLILSFASPYAAHVAKFMNKPHISFTDTEKAKLGILSFSPFTDCIITPDAFNGSFGAKHIRFRGFMELCYLHPKYFQLNQLILSELDITENESFALLRFVSWGANHDIGQTGIPDSDKIKLVRRLTRNMKVYISSEGNMPDELNKYKIQILPQDMHSVLAFASIYIGEGATMASESAMLGTPAIYVNSLTSGTIEAQQRYGLLFSYRNFSKVISKVDELLCIQNLKQEFSNRRGSMLKDQIDVTSFMVWFIENYPVSFRIMSENPRYQDRFI